MRIKMGVTALCLVVFVTAEAQQSTSDIEQQVAERERAFAQSMADRDLEAFAGFISEEGIFLGSQALRGRDAVVASWASFFEEETAPFSWEPETILVLESGNLALSTGPVHNREGKHTSVFTSTWRKEEDGEWRVVFDRGNRVCD